MAGRDEGQVDDLPADDPMAVAEHESDRWTWVAIGTCVVAVLAVAITTAADGIHVEHAWIAAVVVATIAALEQQPLSVTAGHRTRVYVYVSEVGVGLGLLWLSPAALAMATATAFVPTLLQPRFPPWKRAFAAGQATLAALAAALVFDWAGHEVTIVVVALAAVASWTVGTVPMLLMLDALSEEAVGRGLLRTAPRGFAVSTAALAVGVSISPLLGLSRGTAAIGLVGVAGVIAVVRLNHTSAMRADRLRVLLAATIDLQRAGAVADLDDLLRSLGPVVIPGVDGLRRHTDHPGPGGLAARLDDDSWLVAEYGPGANPPGREDAERLEILAAVVSDTLDQRGRLAEAILDSTTEPMTGLLNQRGLDLAVAGLAQPAAIAMVDLDGLKPINDTHGHKYGDAALVAVGDALRNELRASDIAARIGGDEFLVVLPGLSLDDARTILERMSSSLATADVAPGVVVSVTIGLAEWSPFAGPSLKDVIHAADAQMYARRRVDRA